MGNVCVVTGGGRGVGRAVVERLLADAWVVVLVEADVNALGWVAQHPQHDRMILVQGDAGDPAVADRAAEAAETAGGLSGWVNNAARFRDASVHTDAPDHIVALVTMNLAPAIVGCTAAVRTLLTAGRSGAIVNVSSHQAQRPVPGCLPYVVAKAGLEGMTRALAVEYGLRGIRVNAISLGSIRTQRYDAHLADQPPQVAAHIQHQMAAIHPIGRIGRADEAAAVVAFLLSDDASFITGATIPVDGGRSSLGQDPEAHPRV